jgi:hypothetical protein
VTYIDNTILPGNTYDYYAVAVNAGGPSTPSNTATVVVPPAPAAPSNFTGTATITGGGTTARIRLNWTDNATNESGFQIQRSTSADFTTGVLTYNPGSNITTWTWGNLPRGTSYWIRIRALNQFGGSEWVLLTPFPIVTP